MRESSKESSSRGAFIVTCRKKRDSKEKVGKQEKGEPSEQAQAIWDQVLRMEGGQRSLFLGTKSDLRRKQNETKILTETEMQKMKEIARWKKTKKRKMKVKKQKKRRRRSRMKRKKNDLKMVSITQTQRLHQQEAAAQAES